MASLRFPFLFSQPHKTPSSATSDAPSRSFSTVAVALASGGSALAAAGAIIAITQSPKNPFLENAMNFLLSNFSPNKNHSSPLWGSVSLADNSAPVTESRAGMAFPSILKDTQRLLGIGLRKKAVFGLKNIDVYAYGVYADDVDVKKCLAEKHGRHSVSELQQKEELRNHLMENDIRMTVRLQIVYGRLSINSVRSAFEESVGSRLHKFGGYDNKELLQRFTSQFKDEIKLPRGSIIELSRDHDYILHTTIDGKEVGSIQSKLLCRSILDLYIGDESFDHKANEDVESNLASLLHNTTVIGGTVYNVGDSGSWNGDNVDFHMRASSRTFQVYLGEQQRVLCPQNCLLSSYDAFRVMFDGGYRDLLRAADQYLLKGLKHLCEYAIAQVSAGDLSVLGEDLCQVSPDNFLSSFPGLLLNSAGLTLAGGRSLSCRNNQPPAAISSANPPSLSSTIQVVGWKGAGGSGSQNSKLFNSFEDIQEEYDWNDLETDLYHWTKTLRPVQWYPGHIAKTEKELKEQLKLMDVVIEVRDARIPVSTSHPQMDSWLGNRKRILVLNREDMISTADRNAWATYYANQGIKVVFSNGQLGMGALKLGRLAKALAGTVNIKRKAKGLLPRPVRAGVVGYPNVGKSSLVNRLLKRRMCAAAPRPGVTRELKWVRFGKDLELLDSPGIIPMRISDQTAAIKLAICDDIGERSYDAADVAAILVQMLSRLPTVGNKALCDRYKIEADGRCGKIFVQKLAVQLFNADNNQAAFRILQDFRKGKFGWIALERPPK
ncbi:hypothetical protein KY284_029393 [Solanum tuberosum]|nr:hypothetical protein KY284_029393 [Solanum tuberosum]